MMPECWAVRIFWALLFIFICFRSSLPKVFMCEACLDEIFRDATMEDLLVFLKTANFNQSLGFPTHVAEL